MKTLLIILLLFVLLEIPTSYGMGLIFKKLGLEQKKGLIPFYNKIILIKQYNLPQYHLILIFIPVIGLYTNYIIYKRIIKNHELDNSYIMQLTLFPFVFNIFLGTELKQEEIKENTEKEKNIEEIEEDKEETKDEYVWHPKKSMKSDVVYKASRNKLNAKVNINIENNDEIIDNKKNKKEKEIENPKICPNCGAKNKSKSDTCYICGTKL